MMHRFVIVPLVVGAVLVTVGCATKKFVREELKKSEVKLEQQVGKVEGDLSQERARVSTVATEVTQVRGIATEATKRADQATGMAGQAGTKAEEATGKAGQAIAKADAASGKADEASGKAGQAFGKADETDNRLTRLWVNRNKRTLVETVVINFGFDKWELDDKAQTSLLDVVKQIQGNPNLFVDLEGYTDSVGAAPYNVQLSQRRSEAVRRHLVEKGVDLSRIQSIGLGTARPMSDNKTKQGRDQNRRVAVKVFAPTD